MLLVDGAHQRRCGWQDLIDEDEDGLLGRELDALPDHIDELANRQVCGDQVLFLVDGRNVRLLDLLADNLEAGAISIRLSNVTRANIKAQSDGDKRLVSPLTGIRSVYFWRMRSASALRFSKGCSSLNLERMIDECVDLCI